MQTATKEKIHNAKVCVEIRTKYYINARLSRFKLAETNNKSQRDRSFFLAALIKSILDRKNNVTCSFKSKFKRNTKGKSLTEHWAWPPKVLPVTAWGTCWKLYEWFMKWFRSNIRSDVSLAFLVCFKHSLLRIYRLNSFCEWRLNSLPCWTCRDLYLLAGSAATVTSWLGP